MPTTVYTDGACVGNPGPGGWAWAVKGGRFAAGPDSHTTNQRMEIKAVLEAVGALDGELEVVSDSTYVVHCFRDRWWEGWIARGWRNSQKKPVANRDLWEPLIEAYRADPKRISFTWVKGHSDDEMNDLVDRLAVMAARDQTPVEGEGEPPVLGDPDAAGRPGSAAVLTRATASPGAAAHLPAGHLVAVTGHRPPELGGYDANLISDSVLRRLGEVLAAKFAIEPDLTVLTGLGLGAEQLAAEAAIEAGIPFVAVLPFPDPQSVWPVSSQQRFEALLAQAADVIPLERNAPETKQNAGAALARRDAWLVRNAHEAIVVWNGADANLGRLVRSFRQSLGEENVWVLEP